jgi:glycosyltransferase involved in cell wall biosynthesis
MNEFVVVIPAYNAQATVHTAITSSFEAGAMEVVVIDDGSHDGTSLNAKVAGASVYRIPNGGAADARLTGLRYAEKEFVVFLDADDQLSPGGIRAGIEALSNNPQAVGVSGNTRYSSDSGKTVSVPGWGEGVTTRSLLTRAQPPGPPGSFIWRRSLLVRQEALDPPPLKTRFAEDYELVIRASMLGEIVCVVADFCVYAASGGKSSRSPMNSLLDAEKQRRYYADFLGIAIHRRGTRKLRARVYLRKAFEARVAGQRLSYMLSIFGALILDPGFFLRSSAKRVRQVLSSARGS